MHHINQLRSVAALTEFRSFSRAAESLGITQSALSQHVKKLESFYGVQLFERHHGRVDLTAFGEVVVASANEILDSLGGMQKQLEQLSNLETGRITIAVDPYFATSLVAPILANLMTEYPSLKFNVRTGTYAEFETGLRNGNVDLYLGIPPNQISPDLACEYLDVPTPLLLCPAEHPLAARKSVSLEQILQHRIVTLEPPAWYVDWVRDQLGGADGYSRVEQMMILDADNIGVVKLVALNSNSLLAALYSDVEDEIANGSLKRFSLKNWPKKMTGCILTRAARPNSPGISILLDEYRALASAQLKRHR